MSPVAYTLIANRDAERCQISDSECIFTSALGDQCYIIEDAIDSSDDTSGMRHLRPDLVRPKVYNMGNPDKQKVY